jgi:nitroreductase
MEFMNVLAGRRSVRSYTSEPVERAEIEGLIRAAVLAPSGMNSQPWAFVVIEGARRLCALSVRVKAALLTRVDREPALARYRDRLSDPAFNVFYDAPALVLVCAKPTGYDPNGACAMAAHALMLAAHDRGLGTCWIGFAEGLFQLPETKAEFGIPPAHRVVAPIIVGHPTAEVPPTPRNEPEVLWM